MVCKGTPGVTPCKPKPVAGIRAEPWWGVEKIGDGGTPPIIQKNAGNIVSQSKKYL